MIIKYIHGDLFKTSNRYLMHGCNSKGVMGSGIAKQVRAVYPTAYEEYSYWCSKGFRLGDILSVDDKDKTIINAVTQQNYGREPNTRYVSYDAISSVFSKVNTIYAGKLISIPKIGSSLGGGNWEAIQAIINSETPDITIEVYIYE